MRKFKIDLCWHSTAFPFALYFERRGWFRTRWEEIYNAATQAECVTFHEKIKDLPEYL